MMERIKQIIGQLVPNVSERYLYKQLYRLFNKILSVQRCGFRKGLQISALHYQTNSKMETMFRPRFNVWYSAY